MKCEICGYKDKVICKSQCRYDLSDISEGMFYQILIDHFQAKKPTKWVMRRILKHGFKKIDENINSK